MKATPQSRPNPCRRVLMLTPRVYPHSPVVNRNVAHLLDSGFYVDIVHVAPSAAREWRGPSHPRLRQYQVPVRHRRSHPLWYLFEYSLFFMFAAVIASANGLRHRYLAVHVDNLPDSMVFAALVPRLRGAPVLLNIADPMPELAAVRLRVRARHPVVRLARLVERLSAAWASTVTVPNETPCRRLVVERGTSERKVHVLPNLLPAPWAEPLPKPGPPVMMYLGTLLERYGVSVAIEALDQLRDRHPSLVLSVLGSGEHEALFKRRAEQLGLSGRVRFLGFLPWPAAMAEVAQATVGVVPLLADGYGELMTPTKLFDFVQQGVPSVCSRLPGIEAFFPEDSVVYCEPGDARSLAAGIDWVLNNPDAALERARRAQQALVRFSWERVGQQYLELLGVAGA